MTDNNAVAPIKVGDYAFWRYDSYPYLLGGEITAIANQAHRVVRTKQYGGHGFRASFTTDPQTGEKLLAEIKRLTELRRQVLRAAEAQLRSARDESFKRLVPEVFDV